MALFNNDADLMRYAQGFDPNWFANLSPDIQRRANAERQRVGATQMATDRPATFVESWPSVTPSQIPDALNQAIREAERTGQQTMINTGGQAGGQPTIQSTAQSAAQRAQDLMNAGVAQSAGLSPATTWIRDLFPGATWDAGTRTISGLPFGMSLGENQFETRDGRAYVNPSALAGMFASRQPAALTPELFAQKQQVAESIFGPLYESGQGALQRRLNEIQQQAQNLRGVAEADFGQARHNLQGRERDLWNRLAKSAGVRGIADSPLVMHQQRQVGESFAPEHQQLEAGAAARLAQIASEAAMGTENVSAQARDLERTFASQLAQSALQMFEDRRAEEIRQNDQIMNFLLGRGQEEWDRGMQMLDRTTLTPAQRLEAYLRLAETFGEAGTGVPTVHGNFPQSGFGAGGGLGAGGGIGGGTGTIATTSPTVSAGLDLDNERRYLVNLAQTGNAGERAWAINQARSYGIDLGIPGVQTATQRATPVQTSSPTQNVTVRSGDTLSAIAQQNNTTVANLQRLNPQITNPNRIFPGANIKVS